MDLYQEIKYQVVCILQPLLVLYLIVVIARFLIRAGFFWRFHEKMVGDDKQPSCLLVHVLDNKNNGFNGLARMPQLNRLSKKSRDELFVTIEHYFDCLLREYLNHAPCPICN